VLLKIAVFYGFEQSATEQAFVASNDHELLVCLPSIGRF
jgi:hypothetical protein